MALIKCSKCGKEISDKSSKCVHCGSTTKKFENAVKLKNSESFNKKINCKLLNTIISPHTVIILHRCFIVLIYRCIRYIKGDKKF